MKMVCCCHLYLLVLQLYDFPTNPAPLAVTNLVIGSTRILSSDNEVQVDITWNRPSIRNGSFETRLTFSASQTPDYPPQRSTSLPAQEMILPQEKTTFTILRGLPYAEYTFTLQPFNIKTSNPAPPVSQTMRTIAIGKPLT